jgi:hypothetical protein
MTQMELLAIARKEKPGVRYAASKDGNAIGGWDDSLGRFVMVASKTITGEWLLCPYELLINGAPPYQPSDWQE